MAKHVDGDLRRPLLPEEDDWFLEPSDARSEPTEVAWLDEPEPLPQRAAGVRQRRRAALVLVIVVAGVLIAAGLLITGAISSSDGTKAPPRSSTRGSTTPRVTTPARTSPAPTQSSTKKSPTAVPTGKVLRVGSTGAAVKRLQQALTRLGYSPGTADSSYGAATARAVFAFQQAHGLTGDGVAGAKTLAAINAQPAR